MVDTAGSYTIYPHASHELVAVSNAKCQRIAVVFVCWKARKSHWMENYVPIHTHKGWHGPILQGDSSNICDGMRRLTISSMPRPMPLSILQFHNRILCRTMWSPQHARMKVLHWPWHSWNGFRNSTPRNSPLFDQQHVLGEQGFGELRISFFAMGVLPGTIKKVE